jgi:hypothetical protein
MPNLGRRPITEPRLCAGGCQTVWPITEYRRYGRISRYCRLCYSRRNSEYEKRQKKLNPAWAKRRAAYRKEYYAKNREAELAKVAAYRERNLEIVRHRTRRRRLARLKEHWATFGHAFTRFASNEAICRVCLESAVYLPYTARPNSRLVALVESDLRIAA